MQFVQENGVWLLVTNAETGKRRIIAELRSEIEVVALSEFCRLTLSAHDRIPEHFSVTYEGVDYTVTPLGAPGEKLDLVIRGRDHSSTVATEFVLPRAEDPN